MTYLTQAVDEDLAALRARVALSTKFAWIVVSGLTAIAAREQGEKALNDIWAALLSSEQKHRFLEALKKLGIDQGPPATIAARYHYFSNAIGGLTMHYIEETPKKVWIRYMSPWGSYPGISALLVPPSVRRTILTTWHPRNGELLGCPRLGWVVTKFVSEGHPYDEGYFCEYDHDLAPEERCRVETVERSPEFDPAKAPKLDPVAWPEARWLKGNHNYAVDYLGHVLQIMERLFGTLVAAQLNERGMRMLAVQYTADLARTVGITGNDVGAIAGLLAAILRSFKASVDLHRNADRAALTFADFPPFQQTRSPDIRTAFFAFFAMAVRVLNGRVSIARELPEPGGAETWTLVDQKAWLW
jgi:hypothetical protein